MKGLEAMEARLSQIQNDVCALRIDSEYFLKDRVAANEKLLLLPSTVPLKENCSKITQGPNPNFVDEGIACLNGKNIYFGTSSAGEPNFVTANEFKTLSNFALRKGDVLITLKHATKIGRVWIKEEDSKALFSRNVGLIRTNSSARLRAVPLLFTLWSSYYQLALDRLATGGTNGQITLATTPLAGLSVPLFGEQFQRSIENCFSQAQKLTGIAKAEARMAEQLLLTSLGLAGWHPPHPLTYTRRASEVFAARRVDSPYFSPRVSQLLQLLARDNACIGDVAPARHEEFVADSIGEFDYIEISDIQADGTAASNCLPQAEAPSRATWYVRPGDVLASTVRPIRRLSAIVAPEQDSFVCSSGFVVLAPQTVSPELLLTYLRLPQVCELMDLHTSASMYPAISERDLLNLPFRRVPSDVERKIVSAVQQSHSARREAYILLDRAKRAVEIAIEQSEAEALRYLSESSV